MYRATVIVFCLLLFCRCSPDSEKARAEKVNDDKLENRDERDAHLVIDLLDTSYGLIDLARIGERRLSTADQKGRAQRIIEGHTSAMVKLKTYAEKKGIIIPFSGPEKTKGKIERLEKKESDFDQAWVQQIKEMQHKLKSDIEGYHKKATDPALLKVLDTTLIMVEQNNNIISDLENETNKESI